MDKIKIKRPPRRDDHNNPLWDLDLPVEVSRQDNSMSLTMHAGNIIGKKGKSVGDVSLVIGGFVFIVHDKKSGIRLAINFKSSIEKVFDSVDLFTSAPKLPLKKLKKKSSK